MATAVEYRRPLFDPNDVLFMRCLTTSAIAAVLLVIAVRFIPAPPPRPVVKVEQLPQRFAKLILEPAKKVPPPVLPAGDKARTAKPEPAGGGAPGEAGSGGGDVAKVEPVRKPVPAPGAPSGNRKVETMHSLAPSGGAPGRARAPAEGGAQIASSSAALSSALAGLTTSLGVTSSATGGSVSRGGRSRGIRDASSSSDLGRVNASLGSGGSGGAAGDLAGSALKGTLVSIGELAAGLGGAGGGIGTGGAPGGAGSGGIGSGTGPGAGGGSGGGSGGGHGSGAGSGAGAGPGVYRSNASLLSVIQRYAAGIQYCYGNELKRDPTLRGKLVVAITVEASGEVSEASVVQNTTGSQRLATCALSQVRDWRFPPVPVGATTFQAPFVFTPPN
jgi:TonB family protein